MRGEEMADDRSWDQLRCEDCKSSQTKRESWWCRNCALTICKSCNLINGHTEHRSAPWQENDVLRSCALLLEARCSRRSRQAADEEIAIKEFIAEVEALLISKVHGRLEEENELDRRRISAVCCALGLEVKTYHIPSPGSLPTLKAPTDDQVDRVVYAATRVMKSPQLRETMEAKLPDKQSIPSKSSFAILPDVSADEFTRILENKLASRLGDSAYCAAARKRETSSDNGFHSEGDLPGISGDISSTHFLSVGKHNLHNGLNHNVSTSTPLDEDDSGPQFRFPLEPKINISNDPLPNSADRSPILRRSNGSLAKGVESDNKSQSSLLMEKLTGDSRSSSRLGCPLDSFSLNDTYDTDGRVSRLSGRRSIQMMVHEGGGAGRLLNGSVPVGDGRTPTPTTGVDSVDGGKRKSRQRKSSSHRPSTSSTSTQHILSFHFGSEYLSRPIDVCALPGDQLAVSDSCGGVYVTQKNGNIVQKITTEEASASSLYYCPGKDALYVSVMKKRGRQVNVYERSSGFQLIDTMECPKDPKIEQSRTRWLAVGKSGELFSVSGDNKRSALWKYNHFETRWVTVKEEKNARYQYLEVTENRPEDSSVVLLTCEGISGALILFVVGRNGKLWAQYNLCDTYHLRDYIRSPASAVVDSQGNLLVLDYTNGKLWILLEGGEGVRRLKCLADVGSQQGLGLAVSGQWCFVACFNKKRVQALKYLDLEEEEEEDEVFPAGTGRRSSTLSQTT